MKKLRFQDFRQITLKPLFTKVFVDFVKISKSTNQKNNKNQQSFVNKGLNQDSKISKLLQKKFQDFTSIKSVFICLQKLFLRLQPVPPPYTWRVKTLHVWNGVFQLFVFQLFEFLPTTKIKL